jgi:Na+-translocating ferredoxin:NAD+ oxidoreductase subunit D
MAILSKSPHLKNSQSTEQIMMRVVLALIPGVLIMTTFFGFGTLIQIMLCISTGLIIEVAVLRLRKRPLSIIKDNSALVTCVLLAISIPSYSPWWISVLGCFFAIGIVKHLYGGLGQNIFNPAMAAYAFLLISFPVQMTQWLDPEAIPLNTAFADQFVRIFAPTSIEWDALSSATPLDEVKSKLHQGLMNVEIMDGKHFNFIAGIGWSWINFAFLLGGAFLLVTKTIQWQISTAFLLSLFVCSAVHYLLGAEAAATPMLHLWSGGTMLGAFFILTDPVTASTTPRGRLVFGALIGVLVYLIRTYGGYPDAIAFAVLLANICVPLIDLYTKPRVYGHEL